MKLKRFFLIPLMLLIVAILLSTVSAKKVDNPIIQLNIEDAIGPATEDYVERALEAAALGHAELVVIRLDTPGGLDSAMRGIIKNITSSTVPVAVYIAPSGARAASAGTYILYASHIAAMAPGTNLGAATPVQIGGISPPGIKDKDKPEIDANKEAMKNKVINDAAAYIRGLA
ncbi:MAG: nodulation protein NfeD, partial [Gammaproteobacteria bacterium]|nr:nodulation protein NfeD [Gammaproteobacteria bacterium]